MVHGFMHIPEDQLYLHFFCSSLESLMGCKSKREAPLPASLAEALRTWSVFSARHFSPGDSPPQPAAPGVESPNGPAWPCSPPPAQVHRPFHLESSLLQETDGSNKNNKQ